MSASVPLPAVGFLNLTFDDKASSSLLDEFATYRDEWRTGKPVPLQTK
jgi:hypothetical protein